MITYIFFGKTKNVEIFNYLKDINLSWSTTYGISGSYSANVYLPLPPPVSFIGINFSFTISYSVSVTLYANGGASVNNCVYKFEVGANASTEVNADASAAIRVLVI